MTRGIHGGAGRGWRMNSIIVQRTPSSISSTTGNFRITANQPASATNSASRMILPAMTARMRQYPMISPSIQPRRVDHAAYWRTTNYRVKPLWLNRMIDWAWARYGPSHERSRRQTAHRWVENGTCALSKSWPEYRTNHRVDYPAPYHRPADPPNWIRAAEYRAHGSAIKRPAPVQRNRARSPYPVMRHVRSMPKPPVGMVRLIPWRHSGSPPEEIGWVRISRRRRPIFERQWQDAGQR